MQPDQAHGVLFLIKYPNVMPKCPDRYRPWKTGFLFSWKARSASLRSSVPRTRSYMRFSFSSLDYVPGIIMSEV